MGLVFLNHLVENVLEFQINVSEETIFQLNVDPHVEKAQEMCKINEFCYSE